VFQLRRLDLGDVISIILVKFITGHVSLQKIVERADEGSYFRINWT
jgi:hypothetical protein